MGNHDFDVCICVRASTSLHTTTYAAALTPQFGVANLRKAMKRSTFPWLITNATSASQGGPLAGGEPWTIIEHAGVKVQRCAVPSTIHTAASHFCETHPRGHRLA